MNSLHFIAQSELQVQISVLVNGSTVTVLGRDEGYMVKYNPLPEGVPEGEAPGNS